MRIIRCLSQPEDLKIKALTIGNFDGIHLGHQAVLRRVKEVSAIDKCQSAVLTFENHPSTILRPHHSTLLLCSLPHKLKLLEEQGIDLVILLPFTRDLSQKTADQFLSLLRTSFPFEHLILGHDATLGKERHGDHKAIQQLSEHLHFQVEYLPPYLMEETAVSSTQIRQSIQTGHLAEAKKFLGRPFSIYSTVISGQGFGQKLGFATANLNVEGLCLPPLGVYAIHVIEGQNHYQGVANLGLAPTLRKSTQPLLEAHLFDCQESLYGRDVEVVLHQFIRSETQFSSLEELKSQIAKDILQAKHFLKGYTQ